MKKMSENDVSESVGEYLSREYAEKGNVVYHFEAIDSDGDRPDLLVFVEY
jgi:hypothetical protein